MAFRGKTELKHRVTSAVKYITVVPLRALMKLAFITKPTQKQTILLESFKGTRLDCNPLALYNYLRTTYPGKFKYIWAACDPERWTKLSANDDTTVVRFNSTEHWEKSCTSGVLIVNVYRSATLPSRKKQLQVQTWHGGGCYKKVGITQNHVSWGDRQFTSMQYNRHDYIISSCKMFSDIEVRNAFMYRGKILECGMPRNDRLVNPDAADRSAVRERLGLSEGDFLVLYAPTWRAAHDAIVPPDIARVKKAFHTLSGKNVVFASRGHSNSAGQDFHADMQLDDFDDMQGLLLASDALITDYSSSIWDFSFTYRPCFLYTPDLQRYEQSDKGFNTDIHTWGFPVCETMDELVSAIEQFDAVNFTSKMRKHHDDFGSFETGHACEVVAKVICDYVDGDK